MYSRRRLRRLSSAAIAGSIALALLAGGCQLFHRTPTSPPTVAPSATPEAAASPGGPATPEPLGPYDANTLVPMSPRAQNARVLVLMYHDVMVERHGEDRAVNVTKEEFADQIDFFQKQGANFLTLEQLHRHLTRGEDVPANSVVLTFDDNYQGFYDNAWPLLKEKKIPAAVFVHTNYVGDVSGKHPKMSWETLKELDTSGLITIGSHTLSHPPDLTKLSESQQETELHESKTTLEQQLGHPIPFFAYPDGNEDATTVSVAQSVGYTMAFTMHNAPAEESPSVLTVNRYNYTQYEKGWEDCRNAEENAPASVVEMTLSGAPVTLHVGTFDGTKLGFVTGGSPTTWRNPAGTRNSVGEFVQMAQGKGLQAVAGMNGTFFANANLRGTDNAMIGPCKTYADPTFYPETAEYRLPKLLNRPFVMWGPTRFAIIPFNPMTMNDEMALKSYMPDYTDAFLAGAWIVHGGKARTKEEMSAYSARDFNDPRRRAFFGVTATGDIVLGGTLDVVTTEKTAKAAAEAGLQEAVLMDSGFSTSIVFDNKIIVTGHTAKDLPSRPVPHSIVLSGTLVQPTEPTTLTALQAADSAVGAVSAAEAQANAPPGATAAGSSGGSTDDTKPRRRRHRK